MKLKLLIFFAAFIGIAQYSLAVSFTPGNILVSKRNLITEYTRYGDLVQSIPVELPSSAPSRRQEATDIVYDSNGFLHVRNMAGWPYDYISSLNLATDEWTHTEAYLLEQGNLNRQLTQQGNYLFTDDIKFDLSNRTFERIDFDILHERYGPKETTIGRDGYLYSTNSGSPKSKLYKFDPQTLLPVRDELILLDENGYRESAYGIAVGGNSDVFIAGFSGNVRKYTPEGTLLSSYYVREQGLSDIDIADDGLIAVVSRNSNLYLFDKSLTFMRKLTVGHGIRVPAYVTFVPVPEMSAIWLCSIACGILRLRIRRRSVALL